MRYLLCIFLTCYLTYSNAQNTLGTIYNTEEALDGYTFFSPFSGTKAYMVDNCGRLVNEWDRGTRPGLAAYFLENGMMLRTYKVNPLGPFTSASNAGGLELVDWDNNTVWSYEFNTDTSLSHHDVAYMPNGNILVLTWELITAEELIALGRDPNEISSMGFAWNEKIIEIKPVGSNEIEVIWEWKMRDHYIQDFDSRKANFGIVSNHPELFDINLPDINGNDSHAYADYNHFNAIDYNEDLDQILISVRNSDEIWVIDHSTTTAEAASHSGGVYGQGGDLMYRWGNPAAYQQGTLSDQKLFGQHGTNWIRDPETGEHQILIFNNGNGRIGNDYSTGEIISPPFTSDNNYEVSDGTFGPEGPTWIYGNLQHDRKLSSFLSNIQLLENGNFLMNYGSLGELVEINRVGDSVWEYVLPLSGDIAGSQGQQPNNNATFRAYKFGKNFSGFDGIDIEAGSTIERGTDLDLCQLFTPTEDLALASFSTYVANNQLYIADTDGNELSIYVYDVQGKLSFERTSTLETVFDLQGLSNGIYFVTIIHSKLRQTVTRKISITHK